MKFLQGLSCTEYAASFALSVAVQLQRPAIGDHIRTCEGFTWLYERMVVNMQRAKYAFIRKWLIHCSATRRKNT
jgi:hypothetical protein